MPSPADSSNDHLDRLFRRLVTNLAALDPSSLDRAFPIADVYERLVPYRTHRAALGLDSSEDYELTVLRLLAGERGYAVLTPDDVREAIEREVHGVNPDLGLLHEFPDAHLLLDPDQVARVLDEAASASGIQQPSAPEATPRPEPASPFQVLEQSRDAGEEPSAEQPTFLLEEQIEESPAPAARPREVSPISAPCSYCGGALPVGRTVLFCPHCGQNIGVVHCPTCGAELDVGWRFCIACGQRATGID